VRLDRRAIARYGVNAEDVMNVVAAVAGHPVGEVFEGQRRFTLQVRLAPEARQVQRPLATVVIGGLVTATMLTLFLLPAIYSRLGGDLPASRHTPG
jgi:Cu/Ag efflux pump CusA